MITKATCVNFLNIFKTEIYDLTNYMKVQHNVNQNQAYVPKTNSALLNYQLFDSWQGEKQTIIM